MGGQKPPHGPGRPGDEEQAAVRTVVLPVITGAGLDLEDLQFRKAGSRLQVRILVDRDGGVTLDEAAALSRDIATVLDEGAVLRERPYLLDVGSPGVDRPLQLVRHWRRNTGRLVRLTMVDGESTTGRIREVAGQHDGDPPSSIGIEVDGSVRSFDADRISKAVVQVDFAQRMED